MYACVCLGITEGDVKRAGQAGALTSDALVHVLGLDQATCCGRCLLQIEEFVELAHEDLPPPAPPGKSGSFSRMVGSLLPSQHHHQLA
jgi:bacterioferritin-associated ferredoxin